MTVHPWTCATCETENTETNRFCGQCGDPRADTTAPPRRRLEAFIPPWERPGWKQATPEDPCTEPDCTKTVRDHIAECRSLAQATADRMKAR